MNDDWNIQRIVLATDFSEASSGATRVAHAVARSNRAEMIIAHVLSLPVPPLGGPGTGAAGVYMQVEKDARSHVETVLSAFAERAAAQGIKAKTAILDGVIDEEIVRFAEENKVDLIVIGTHGRKGVSKFFLGSVAARVISSAPCPVLTIRSEA